MGHHNLCILSDDASLASEFISATAGTETLLYLARSCEDALHPIVLERFDLLLIDERLARIDNWNLAHRVRAHVGDDRPILICGLTDRLESVLVDSTRALGVDAFFLKNSLAGQLCARLESLGRGVPQRTEEPTWSPFKPSLTFAREVVEQMEFVDPLDCPIPLGGSGGTSTYKSTLSQESEGKPIAGATAVSTRFRMAPVVEAAFATRKDARAMPDVIGLCFGKVVITEEVARGSTGIVYRARHTSLDIPLAVKVLYPRMAERHPNFVDRFLREARLSARVQGPGAVRVLDCDRDSETGLFYMVMELVDGQTLLDEIKSGEVISELRLTEIGLAVSKVLAEAESLGIVHRDIKPANILTTHLGVIKLADLGLAKLLPKPAAIGAMPQRSITSESILGTPYYIAPEQILTPSSIDHRADIYSLGATLYHAATHVLPFEGATVNDIFYKHLNAAPKDIQELRKDLPPALANTIMRMLAKAPGERHGSCLELSTHFQELYRQAFLADASPRKVQIGLMARLRKRVRAEASAELEPAGHHVCAVVPAGTRKLSG